MRLTTEADCVEKGRVLSVIACFMAGVTYLSWVWLDYSYIFLLLIVLARAYWIHAISIERGKALWTISLRAIAFLTVAAGLLISELMGVWIGFEQLPVFVEGRWYHVLIANIGIAAISNCVKLFCKKSGRLSNAGLKKIIRKARPQNLYLGFLVIISYVLDLLKGVTLGNTYRFRFAMQMVLLDAGMILVCMMISFFVDLTIKNENDESGVP